MTSSIFFFRVVITVPRTLKGQSGQRIYDKLHYCLFCGKGEQKIARHLQNIHKNEEEVKNLKQLDTKFRQLKLQELRGRGDFYKNMKTLRTGGSLVVWRRPLPDAIVSYRDYLPCDHCLVFVSKSELWRHEKKCVLKKSKIGQVNIIKRAELLLYPNQFNDGASDELQALVLQSMMKDQVFQVLSKDKLILTYGSYMLVSSGIRKANGISQRMRILARLLILVREKQSLTDATLLDILQPEMFDTMVLCTKELGGFSMRTSEGENVAYFETPSLPLKIGYTLEKCCSIMKGIGIKTKNSQLIENANNFLELFKLEWNSKIASVCLKTMDVNKFQKVALLPLTDDLMKVRSFLKGVIPKLTKELDEKPSTELWRSLAEALAVRLTIFNRRRGNEVSQLLVTRFNDRHKWKSSELKEIKDSLSPLEKQLMQR